MYFIPTKKFLIKYIQRICQKALHVPFGYGNTMLAAYAFDLAAILRRKPSDHELSRQRDNYKMIIFIYVDW